MTKFEDLPNQRSTRPASRGAFFMPLSMPMQPGRFALTIC